MIINRKESFRKIVYVPSDKSITQRAIIIGAFFNGIEIENPSLCDDCLSALECIKLLGSKVHLEGTILKIEPISHNESLVSVNAGNSATALRLILGVSAGKKIKIEIDGDKSLKKRSIKNLILPLRKMGADITAKRNKCPIINNPKSLNSILIEDCVSAQVKSAIILCLLASKEKGKILERVKTRDHTERMLSYLGANIKSTLKGVTINPQKKPLENRLISVKGDLSSSAFIIANALISGDGYAYIQDVNLNKTRLSFIKLLLRKGADIVIEQDGILNNEPYGSITVNSSTLKPFRISEKATISLIDEIPILAVIASFIKGKSVFKGLNLIKNKESNRMKEIYKNLKKFGVDVKLEEDTLIVRGDKGFSKKSPVIFSKDHRIIMAMSILGYNANGCKIKYPEYVNISYPEFFSLL